MELALFICPPGKIKFGRQVRSAAITMHELDHLPETKRDWVEILNRLDLVITPTEWNLRTWQRAGVTTPIDVVPLGIDPEPTTPPPAGAARSSQCTRILAASPRGRTGARRCGPILRVRGGGRCAAW